jgi:hypothetical protein
MANCRQSRSDYHRCAVEPVRSANVIVNSAPTKIMYRDLRETGSGVALLPLVPTSLCRGEQRVRALRSPIAIVSRIEDEDTLHIARTHERFGTSQCTKCVVAA